MVSAREVTIQLPEELYEQFAAQAKASARAVDTVIAQVLRQQFAARIEPQLPPTLQTELNAMHELSDDALWTIARSSVNPDKLALYDLLTERQQDGSLTAQGQHLLRQLSDDLEAVTLRKAQAFALLRGRGIAVPSLDELRNDPR